MTSNYGDLLLFKVYVVALTALMGAYHWIRVRPRLLAAAAEDGRAMRRLQWTIALETAAGLLVLRLYDAWIRQGGGETALESLRVATRGDDAVDVDPLAI